MSLHPLKRKVKDINDIDNSESVTGSNYGSIITWVIIIIFAHTNEFLFRITSLWTDEVEAYKRMVRGLFNRKIFYSTWMECNKIALEVYESILWRSFCKRINSVKYSCRRLQYLSPRDKFNICLNI